MKKYSREIECFINDHVQGMTTKELVELVNTTHGTDFTESKMKSYKKNHNLKSGTPLGLPAGGATRLFPEHIQNFIGENYHGVGHIGMAELLNKTFGTSYTVSQIKAYYGRRKLDSGLTGQFSKGHIPRNKGMKGVGGWEPTQFKKGNVPVNYRPVGSERVNVDGYVEIKVADPNKWKLKHRILWEEHNGPIPKGHRIVFGDGNKLNINIDNLLLVSGAQMAILNKNRLIQKDIEGTKTAINVVDLLMGIASAKRRVMKKI